MTNKMIIGAAASVLAVMAIAGSAEAAVVSFKLDQKLSDDSDPAFTDVTLEDIEGGVKFTYTLNYDFDGDIVAAYFNVDESVPLPNASFSSPVTGVAYNTRNVQSGNIGATYDIGVAIGEPGLKGGSDRFNDFMFTILADGLDVSDFLEQSFAVRVQSTGEDGEGSAKIGGTSPGMTPIPLPAAGWMLIAGLGGLAAARRRKG